MCSPGQSYPENAGHALKMRTNLNKIWLLLMMSHPVRLWKNCPYSPCTCPKFTLSPVGPSNILCACKPLSCHCIYTLSQPIFHKRTHTFLELSRVHMCLLNSSCDSVYMQLSCVVVRRSWVSTGTALEYPTLWPWPLTFLCLKRSLN